MEWMVGGREGGSVQEEGEDGVVSGNVGNKGNRSGSVEEGGEEGGRREGTISQMGGETQSFCLRWDSFPKHLA